MFPTDFEGSNHIVDKPDAMSREECEPLNVFLGKIILPTEREEMVFISCWKPTLEELIEIQKTGRVWCYHYGYALQPHALSGHQPNFPETE